MDTGSAFPIHLEPRMSGIILVAFETGFCSKDISG